MFTWQNGQPSMVELAETHRAAWKPYGDLAPLTLKDRVKFHMTYQTETSFYGTTLDGRRWLVHGTDGVNAVDIKVTYGDVPVNAEIVAVNDIPIQACADLPADCSPGKAIGIAYRIAELYYTADYLLDCAGAKLKNGAVITEPHKVPPPYSKLRSRNRTVWQGNVCPECASDRAYYHRHGQTR